MHTLVGDARYALRMLWRGRTFAAAALLSLALGIGATTAIYSVASALLLHPLPYADPGRLVILWNRSPGLGITEDWFSTAQYFDIKQGYDGFEQVAIAIGGNFNLTGDGEPERVGTIRLSANLLPMLGARAEIGRLFTGDDTLPGTAGTAVLGHGTWMRRYGGDARVIGRTLTLNGQPYEIIGVLPAGFDIPREVMPTLGGAEHAEILLPLPLQANAAAVRNREDYNILARLKPGVTVARAQAAMDTLTARLRAEHPEVYPPHGGLTFGVVPLHEQVVGDVRRWLLVLTGGVLVVLLVACANVANLLLGRAVGRQKEIAMRAALGAGRGRILRQLLTESVLLALGGAVLGLAFAIATVRGIHVLGTRSVPRLAEVAVNGEVLVFTALLAVGSGILFGLAPALRLGRVDLQASLKEGSGAAAGLAHTWRRGMQTRHALVVAELALSVMVLVAAGLLVRSFLHLQRVPTGFTARGVLTLELTLSGRKYADATRVIETYRELSARLSRVPGASAAGAVSALPLSQMMAWGPIVVEGRVSAPGEDFVNVDQRFVAGDYFRAMEIPLVAGRLFTQHDTRETQRVVVVDEHMARQLWPGEDPLGKRVRTGGMDANPNAPWMTVVGVVGRIKQDALDADSRMALYFPHQQVPGRAMNVVVRAATGDAAGLAAAIRHEIRQLDADLPIYNVRTMEERVSESLARRRFAMLLLALFAALALVLAAVGTYGVVAYLVSQGARDLGIRLALGATPNGILATVLRQVALLGGFGVGLGLLGAYVPTRYMQGLLFGVTTADPVTFGAVALLMILVTLAAGSIPARRAARIDPLASIRSE